MAEITAAVTDQPLDPGAAVATVSAPDTGGIALFVGTVRAEPAVPGKHGAEVVQLEYEAHPELAGPRLEGIAHAACERWDVLRIVAIHRTGTCALGEPTVVVACGAAHRRDALEACRWMIDEIKSGVPIWKREVYRDGSAWVGRGS